MQLLFIVPFVSDVSEDFLMPTNDTEVLMLLITLVNVNAPVVATKSWWLHFSAQVVA